MNRRATSVVGALAAFVGSGCGGEPGGPVAADGSIAGEDAAASDAAPGEADAAYQDPYGCSDLFRQDQLPTYEVEISDGEWTKLNDEFLHRAEREAAGMDIHPYHPIVFRYGAETVANAMIRLKGKSSWRHAIELDHPPKMQFTVSFDEIDPDGDFHRLKKLDLDMPRNDHSFLRNRVALSYLRGAGIPAQCANNARLVINGKYYGLYTSLERVNGRFLKRVFPEAPGGDLWDAGKDLQTNQTTSDKQHIMAFWDPKDDYAKIAAVVDLDASVYEWATEAIINHADGYWGGTHNFFIYDYPGRQFVWLPRDLDTSVDYRAPTLDLVTWWKLPEKPGPHFLTVLGDPAGYAKYVSSLARALAAYDVATIQGWIDGWAAQIAQAAADDPMKPFTAEQHVGAVAHLREAIALRAAFARRWLACANGEAGADLSDGDGDGVRWCKDCDEADPGAKPGAGCLL